MSGLPAEAEVPRTSFTVRSFSLLYRNPEDSRSKESLLAMRADAKRGGLHKKHARFSVWEMPAGGEERPSLPPLRSRGCRM